MKIDLFQKIQYKHRLFWVPAYLVARRKSSIFLAQYIEFWVRSIFGANIIEDTLGGLLLLLLLAIGNSVQGHRPLLFVRLGLIGGSRLPFLSMRAARIWMKSEKGDGCHGQYGPVARRTNERGGWHRERAYGKSVGRPDFWPQFSMPTEQLTRKYEHVTVLNIYSGIFDR